jgi:hypothetical protein
MKMFIARTAARRVAGGRASRTQALLTASATAAALGVFVYKLLRSGD